MKELELLEDLKYFEECIMASLRVPRQLLYGEDNGNSRNHLIVGARARNEYLMGCIGIANFVQHGEDKNETK